MAQQKRYDKEFKLSTFQLVLEQGKPVTQVAHELGLAENTLYNWVSQFKSDSKNAFVGSGNLKPDDQASCFSNFFFDNLNTVIIGNYDLSFPVYCTNESSFQLLSNTAKDHSLFRRTA